MFSFSVCWPHYCKISGEFQDSAEYEKTRGCKIKASIIKWTISQGKHMNTNTFITLFSIFKCLLALVLSLSDKAQVQVLY